MEKLQLKKLLAKAKHLGFPLLIPRSKKKAIANLRDKLFTKLAGWKAKLLSQVGRTTMIKAVASAIAMYPLSFFKMPKTWCLDIDRALKNFWWGHNPNKSRNLHLRSWHSICSHSWVWRSILSTYLLLKRGSCFLVGNGADIGIWDNLWIPDLSTFKPDSRILGVFGSCSHV